MNSVGVVDPIAKHLFVASVKSDPVWSPCVNLARLQMTAFDPVVHHAWTDGKMFCHLRHGQLTGPAKCGRRYLMAEPDPADHCRGIYFAGSADSTFLPKARNDIGIMHLERHFSHSLDDFSRIADPVLHIGRKLDVEIDAGISLPTNMRK